MTPPPPIRQPVAHRWARELAVAGFRGAGRAWRLASAVSPLPAAGLVELAPGLVLAFDPTDWLATEIYRGFYERAEARLISRLVPEGGTAVDVGAHLGYHTALLSGLVGPAGRVLAFEPSPPRLSALRDVVSSLPLDNVELFPVALGSANETKVLHKVDAAHSGLATLRGGAAPDAADVEVEVRRLDSIPGFATLPHIDFLKVDVEGFEEEVLAGAGPIFEDRRVSHALIEVSPRFGPVDYAVDLVERNKGAYSASAVVEEGRLFRRPSLEPLTPATLRQAQGQLNMLMSLRA